MADVILRLRVDPATGKRELVIDYTSDADALPIEHEQAHRAIANQVVAGGLASAQLAVSRASEPAAEQAVVSEGERVATPVPVEPFGPSGSSGSRTT